MPIVEVTSRGFRDNQRAMFDLADKGTQVIIRRRNNRAYTITPMQEDDMELSPALKERIEQGLKNIREGKTHRYTTWDELMKRLGE